MNEAHRVIILQQAQSITRLHVVLRFFQFHVETLLACPPLDTSQEALVNELATGLLFDCLAAKVVNRAMISHWVAEVISEQRVGAKGVAS